jgi:hypothetical protein
MKPALPSLVTSTLTLARSMWASARGRKAPALRGPTRPQGVEPHTDPHDSWNGGCGAPGDAGGHVSAAGPNAMVSA